MERKATDAMRDPSRTLVGKAHTTRYPNSEAILDERWRLLLCRSDAGTQPRNRSNGWAASPCPNTEETVMPKPPPLTDSELDIAERKGATDEQIEAKLRDLMLWSYIVRDPFGMVCAVGRGARADCIENAFKIADEHAIDHFSILENEQDEIRALNDAWRLVLWPPKLDADPRFWGASSGVFEEK